eukprot:3781801-Rhodomonas_salina.1
MRSAEACDRRCPLSVRCGTEAETCGTAVGCAGTERCTVLRPSRAVLRPDMGLVLGWGPGTGGRGDGDEWAAEWGFGALWPYTRAMQCPVLTLLCPYARPTRCPVLTRALSGYGPTRCAV